MNPDEGPGLKGGTAPATGSDDYFDTELFPGEEPVTTGTLFLVMIIMMIIGAVWVIVYLQLLNNG